MFSYKILTINPGSTSTKVSLFAGEKQLMTEKIEHTAEELGAFSSVADQLPVRRAAIDGLLAAYGGTLSRLDACVGRGGGLLPVSGGTYRVDELLLDHARRGANGVEHPAQLGPLLADIYAKQFGCPAFVVNPPDVDEYQNVARLTGVKGVYRKSHLHALNLKETAIRHAARIGKRYEECNFIVCHIGGGISVSAHRRGKMIDGNDIIRGEGPMSPTRCGSMPVQDVIEMCFSGCWSKKELIGLCCSSGGYVSHFGTSDARAVAALAAEGDGTAQLVQNALAYQIAKNIGSMAAVLDGQVDAVLIGGGMANDRALVDKIERSCSFIAPIYTYPGEFEMEAMAAGAIRVLSGQEEVKLYGDEIAKSKERTSSPSQRPLC